MKAFFAKAKRCLSLVLAMGVMASSMNLGMVLQASAASEAEKKTYGALIAANYDLTDAEKALLESGYLADDGMFEYEVPENEDNLVSVDSEKQEITAGDFGEWVATEAKIVVGEEEKETVALTDGKGEYAYAGNAFSVKVTYELETTVDADVQESMLGAGALLKDGVAMLDSVAAQFGNLYILEQAMPEMVEFANEGVDTPMGNVSFSDDMKAAVHDLNEQMDANSGVLNLSVMIKNYDDTDTAKTEYLLTSGADMKDEVSDFVEKVKLIDEALSTMVDNLGFFVENGWMTEDLSKQLKTLAGVCNNLYEGLSAAAADDANWGAAGMTDLVVEDTDYADLDALVAALDEQTEVDVDATLFVDEAVVSFNMSMFNVTVEVVLYAVDEDNEVVKFDTQKTTVTLAEGATKAEILDAVKSSNVVSDAENYWIEEGFGFETSQFDVEYSELPDTLTEDIDYIITYSPKTYTVTKWDGEEVLPYGYKLELPAHEDEKQAYDYFVNDVKTKQGTVITIAKDTVITRALGEAYVDGGLYEIVAKFYGNDIAKAILTSKALLGDEVVAYRQPEGTGLTLAYPELTAEDEAADYEGLSWKPYTYGTEGTENFFDGNTANWPGKSVKVQYRLDLTNMGMGEAKTEEILNLAKTLKEEFAAQKSAMEGLAGLEGTLAQLDKTKLGALNGVIDVTDFSADAAENAEIRAELKSIVSAIIANNLEGNALRIYNIVKTYNVERMAYYYQNYTAIKNEVTSLSGYMTNLMDNEEALRIMCNAAGYGEYADKISDVEGQLNAYNANLSAPNAAIDVNGDKLGSLITALSMDGEVAWDTIGAPYVLSDMLIAQDENVRNVKVNIYTPEGSTDVTIMDLDPGTVLTEDMINDLKAQIDAKVAELLGENEKYYTLTVSKNIDDLIDTKVTADITVKYTYTEKKYTVKIDGEADQTVTISDLEINLPKHTGKNMEYRYIVDGVSGITTSTYTFSAEQIDRLFADGSYVIERIEADTAKEALDEAFGEWLQEDANGNATGLYADIDADQNGVMEFVNVLINAGYSYIALNDEAMLYMNEQNTLEVSLQALVDAVLNDNSFGSDTLINLGKNGKGEMIHAKMDLGNAADDLAFEELDFTLYLNSVPGMMSTVATGLETIKPYMNFQSNNGVMDVEVTLAGKLEKVYQAYLTALLVTGELDKNDVNAINNDIAFNFLWDYIEIIANSDATTTSFTNTLSKLGVSKDLTGYEKYYQMAKKALTNPGIEINEDKTDDQVVIAATANGKSAINGLLGLMGVSIPTDYDQFMGMIKEYKDSGSDVTASMSATLTNTSVDYEAAYVAPQAAGITNKFDFTEKLAAETISGPAAVILLADVEDNLTFTGKTVLDLNGKTVDGSITAKDTLVIIDSQMGANAEVCGAVTGAITGNVKILGGKYDTDVSDKLNKRYTQNDDGVVVNEFYTIVVKDDTLTVILNAGFEKTTEGLKEDAIMVAADLAADLALNYFTAASLAYGEYGIYDIDFTDLIAFITGDAKMEQILAIVDMNGEDGETGIEGFLNSFIKATLDFQNIAASLKDDSYETPIYSYEMTTKPWELKVAHIADGDYVTAGIVSNDELAETVTVNVVVDAAGAKTAAIELTEALAKIVTSDVKINLEDLVFENKNIKFAGDGEAKVVIDLTKDEYAVAMGVVLAAANGMPEMVEALNTYIATGANVALEAAFNAVTVGDVVETLEYMNRGDAFSKYVTASGVDSFDATAAAKVEAAYHELCVAAGYLLNELDFARGMNKTLGGVKTEFGTYEIGNESTKNFKYDRAIYGGYGVALDVSLLPSNVKVILFSEKTEEPPVPTKYSVGITVTGNGTVTADKTEAAEGEIVTLTVAPADGYELDTLTVTDANGQNIAVADNKFTMPAANVTVEATFVEDGGEQPPVPTEYSVTVTVTGNGTVTADKDVAKAGETVTLTVAPADGYKLDTLTVSGVEVTKVNDTTYTFVMPAANVTVSATFVEDGGEEPPVPPTIYTISIDDCENGTVTADKTEAAEGEIVTLTVAPATGYELDTLTVSGLEVTKVNDTTYTFVMPAANVTVTAEFKIIDTPIEPEYEVEIGVAPQFASWITVDPEDAKEGDLVTITVTPDAGWELIGGSLKVMFGSQEIALTEIAPGKYTFIMPAGDVTIYGNFEKINYTVTLEFDSKKGTATVDETTATVGDIVTVTAEPKSGYKLAKTAVTVTKENGDKVNVTPNADGTEYTFNMPAGNVTVKVEFTKKNTGSPTSGGGHYCYSKPYTDLDVKQWYHEYTDYVLEHKLMVGVADKLFAPNMKVTRGMVVTTLYALEGRPEVTVTDEFADVSANDWFAKAVTWANANGVAKGYGNGNFGPNDVVTREQISVMFRSYAAFKGVNTALDTDLSSYKDADQVSAWAVPGMKWAVASDMMKGKSTTDKVLAPLDGTSRVELACLLTHWGKNLSK